jgi:hypothetical protein
MILTVESAQIKTSREHRDENGDTMFSMIIKPTHQYLGYNDIELLLTEKQAAQLYEQIAAPLMQLRANRNTR